MAVPNPAGALTPGRLSTLLLDVPETTSIGPALSLNRQGADIAAPGAQRILDVQFAQNVRFWPSTGAWTLKPLQEDPGRIQEYTVDCVIDNWNVLEGLTADGTVALLEQEPAWKASTDLVGADYSGTVSASGNPFLVKKVPAGVAWNGSLNAGTPQPGPSVLDGIVDIPLKRVAETKNAFDFDQGFWLQWRTPGVVGDSPRYAWSFGFGQYALVIGGDGWAHLIEYTQDVFGNDVQRLRMQFRYCQPSQASDNAYSMMIWPHLGPNGERYITFSSCHLEQSTPVSNNNSAWIANGTPTDITYAPSAALTQNDVDQAPGHITAPGIIGIDMRWDLRMGFQISTLQWMPVGQLGDLPGVIPFQQGNTNPIVPTVIYTATAPGQTVACRVIDSSTNNDFRPGTDFRPQADFALTSDGTNTPILWGYTLTQPANLTTTNTTEFPITGAQGDGLTSVQLSGQGADPTQETGSLTVSDLWDRYPQLRVRGQFAAKLTVTIPDFNTGTKQVSLFRGYVDRPSSKQRGRNVPEGMGIGPLFTGVNRVYPDPQWRDYTLPLVGMWHRLSEYPMGPQYRMYGTDPAALQIDPNSYVPWKVTDVIRDLLTMRGFPQSMIAIPDLPVRLWPGHTAKVDEWMVQPGTDITDFVVRMVKSYLGQYLVFDQNLGPMEADGAPSGAWTLLAAPIGAPVGGSYWSSTQTYAPVYAFVRQPPNPFYPPHLSDAYPDNTAPILGYPEFTNVPPDFNAVLVSTGASMTGKNSKIALWNWMYNPKSFTVPGCTTAADTSHPDYLGRYRPLEVVDPALIVTGNSGSDTDFEATQANIDFTVRRLFDFTCHGRVLQRFSAPLSFIDDPVTGVTRPLRFLDPVSVNGDPTWIIKSVSPEYRFDRVQIARYELIQPVANQQVGGNDNFDSLKRARRGMMSRASGLSTPSNGHALLSTGAGYEISTMELPVLAPAASLGSLQGPDGTPYFMPDYDAVDSAPIM